MRAPPSEFECGIHNVTYLAHKAGCPVCEMERYAENLDQERQSLQNKYRILAEEARRLKVNVDIIAAIRDAVLVTDEADMGFLKTVLYQWRDERSIMLKVTHAATKKRQRGQPNGFIAIHRNGEPVGHACSSMGGLAIAEYFEEAMNSLGQPKAMTILARGLSEHLPGHALQPAPDEPAPDEPRPPSRLSEFALVAYPGTQGAIMHATCKKLFRPHGKENEATIKDVVTACREHFLECRGAAG